MPELTHTDFVRVYDTRTGSILPDPVPAHWIGQPYAAHLKQVPSNGRFAKPNPDAANVITDDPAAAARVIDSPATTQAEDAPAADTTTTEA